MELLKSLPKDLEPKFQSYSETLAGVVALVFNDPTNYPLFIKQYPEDKTGWIERINVLIEWAKEFETQYDHITQWDGEWYDYLEAFIESKLSQ